MSTPSDGGNATHDDAPATADERARAARLGRLVDAMLDGQLAPPAMDAEERALLETATVVHATLGQPALPPARLTAAIDAALGAAREAAAQRAASPTILAAPPSASLAASPRPTSSPRRARWQRRTLGLALTVAAAAAAAAVALFVLHTTGTGPAQAVSAAALRSPDAVIGRPIARSAAADAGARLDVLIADRRAHITPGHGGAP